MKDFTIVSFYKFVTLSDLAAKKVMLLKAMQQQNITGTIILATEGLNGSFCGTSIQIDHLMALLRECCAPTALSFFETYSAFNPFQKAKVKLRHEIVTLGASDVQPQAQTGKHLNPNEWNELLQDPEVVVIDTRNDYEVQLGTFTGAINPNTANFRDFPAYVSKHLDDKKHKKIAMFCTGGIRCEKSTAYLMQQGFDKVYQLDGGILNYLKVMPIEQSRWQGDCFVFDERVAVDAKLNPLTPGTIDKEWKNNCRKQQEKDN